MSMRRELCRRTGPHLAAVALLAATVAPALALGQFPDLPGPAEQTARHDDGLASYAVPVGPWDDGSMLTQTVEGLLERTAWRIAAPGASTLALLAPMRGALLADGWRVIFECAAAECGGFDFRYSTVVLPEPAMHVDLADFRFVALRKGAGPQAEHLSLLVSRSSVAGHVQQIRVRPADAAPRPAVQAASSLGQSAAPPAALPAPRDDFARRLETGTLPLDDLEFDSGAAALAPGDFPSLAALAAYLAAYPDRTILLVGHTDATGGLAGNIALSKRRAEAVRARLISDHGVSPAQVSAEGVGYLVPRDSNLTDEGRTRNRRVEAILAPTR
jgi:outer membrane protein OmpA-like peptidoglycan-associated protein